MTERDATEVDLSKAMRKVQAGWSGELGFSKDEGRNALWILATDGQRCVQIDQRLTNSAPYRRISHLSAVALVIESKDAGIIAAVLTLGS